MAIDVSAPDLDDSNAGIPRHIAIIMDGNNRWAHARGLEGTQGHKKGAQQVKAILKRCAELGIESLTVYAFSSENWRRPSSEVNALMSLFLQALNDEVAELNDNNVCLKFMGDLSRFDQPLKNSMTEAMALTENNDRMTFNVAVNYGGRWDIAEAAKKAAEDVMAKRKSLSDINEHTLAGYMGLADQPTVDLCIRTGGEKRISNFLIWQMAYSELYFAESLWPDFDEQALELALADYAQRQRRFGRTSEQAHRHLRASENSSS